MSGVFERVGRADVRARNRASRTKDRTAQYPSASAHRVLAGARESPLRALPNARLPFCDKRGRAALGPPTPLRALYRSRSAAAAAPSCVGRGHARATARQRGGNAAATAAAALSTFLTARLTRGPRRRRSPLSPTRAFNSDCAAWIRNRGRARGRAVRADLAANPRAGRGNARAAPRRSCARASRRAANRGRTATARERYPP
jgi:hypothetical protein